VSVRTCTGSRHRLTQTAAEGRHLFALPQSTALGAPASQDVSPASLMSAFQSKRALAECLLSTQSRH
jgi:hypothetical protein